MTVVRADLAVAELKRLKDEHVTPSNFASWNTRVQIVLTKAGSTSLEKFKAVKYQSTSTVWSPDVSRGPDLSFPAGVAGAKGIIEAAIYELELSASQDPAADASSFDPDLFAHVKNHIDDQDWAKVASQTAIFVEDRVRRWAGSPKANDGSNLTAKGLFMAVLGDKGGIFCLGQQQSEHEGWRALGSGFAQAVSNVDRHHIQSRQDLRRYAMGVLGLGSLLLTQIKHEHGGKLPKL